MNHVPRRAARTADRHRAVAGLAICLAALAAENASGHGEPFIIDYAHAANRLTIAPGVYDFFNVDENLVTPGFGFPISTIYPGFSRADTLPASTTVTLRFTSPLSYWAATTGPLDPLPLASGTIEVVNRAAATATISALGVGGTNPLVLDTFVGHPGEHHHVTAYELVHPDAAGLYGIWAEAIGTGPSYPGGTTAASDPFLIVLNWGIEDEQLYQDGVTRLARLPDPVITITVASGTQTQAQAGHPLLSGTTPVVKAGAGTLVVDQPNPLAGSTTIGAGRLVLAAAEALATSRVVPLAGGTLAVAPALEATLGGLDATAGGLVDVGTGRVTVAGGLTAGDLVAALQAGRAGGSWSGASGITSTAVAAEVAAGVPRAVGWLDAGDGSVAFAYAAPGDTNIDWSIDILDAANFLALGKFDAGTPATWLEGDFSFDGIVDILDAADFFATGLFDAGGYNAAAAGGLAAVPEPAVGRAAAAALAVGWLARRWRPQRVRRAGPPARSPRSRCGARVAPG
jgi:autotransporter-associated beta strand protein